MLLSLSWLKEFTPYQGPVDELAHRLTMVGLEVEEIQKPFDHLSGIVVGHVLEKYTHPDADKLSLCRVDIGSGEPLSIVCGAPNVAAGQKVAVAPAGTELPGGLFIKKAKIRGHVSQGMICSETELELGTDSSGIMVLDEGLSPGTGIISALELEEYVLDIGVTPNRPDCLSVLGLARETAAVFDLPLTMPVFNLKEDQSINCPELIKIAIEDSSGCPLYQARLISGCRVAPSPSAIRYRLMAVGIRPINNIVDVTNYVLMELGQPLHSFDRNLLAGSVVRVARASDGMEFTTLDDQKRKLVRDDLLIWDKERPVALAGVMGGANTEIHSQSNNVLLECAVFDPLSIRKTARRLALSSESSFRFERGVDQAGSAFALDRASALISSLTGGRVANGVALSEPRPVRSRSIYFRPARANTLLALDVDEEYCIKNLSLLGCKVKRRDPGFDVEPPGYRPDLEREVDLIEEVGRIYGLDRIPEHLPQVKKSLDRKGLDVRYAFDSKIKQWARGQGLNEVINYSFVGTADLDSLGIGRRHRVKVFNPLSEEQDVLRTDLLPGLLQTLRHNLGHGSTRLKVFEAANSFTDDPDSETGVRETNRLAIMLCGSRHSRQWPYPEEEFDYSDIKGLVENLIVVFAGKSSQFRDYGEHPYLSPAVLCCCGSLDIGVLGRINPEMTRTYKARKEVWYADINLEQLQRMHDFRHIWFEALPKYPVVRRDMTVVAPMDLKYEQIAGAVYESGPEILEDVTLIDIYLPDGAREMKMSFRLTYRHPGKTLKDKEVDKVHQKLGQAILAKLPVRFS